METSQDAKQEVVDEIFNYVAKLLINERKNKSEVEQILVEKGIDAESAKVVIDAISEQIKKAKKEKASKDILYGALWCIGGIAATIADFGYIFWGAIVFGGVQFLKGIMYS